VAKASGTYYDAKVDENAKKNLGVVLKDFKVGAAQADIPFWTYANLEAEILDTPIDVQYSCSVDGQAPSRFLQPEGIVKYAVSHEVQIGCFYDAYTLTEGTKKFNLNITYPFETFASIETFFIDNDRFTALKRQNVDLQKEYGIVEKPSAITTDGPVKIGMGIGAKQPIIIHKNLDEFVFNMGVTIDRKAGWATEGKILDTSELVVIVPKEVILESVSVSIAPLPTGKKVPGNLTLGSCEDLSAEYRPGCDDSKVSLYLIFPDFAFMSDKDLEAFFAFPTSYNIIGSIPSSEFDAILKTTGVASHLFRAALGYEFGISKSLPFTVRKALRPRPPPVDTAPPGVVNP
jgi:hypothetical protein